MIRWNFPKGTNFYKFSRLRVGRANAWHFGYKAHIGAGQDSGYTGAEKRDDAITRNARGKKITYKTSRRPSQSKKKSVRSQAQIKRREREKSSVRAEAEHVSGVVKGQFGYRKTRYQGLPKQTAKPNMLFVLANLVLADRSCLAV